MNKNLIWKPLVLLLISISALADPNSELQRSLASAMHQYNIPNLSVSVIRSGKTIYVADLDKNSDGTVTTGPGITHFRVASVTKLFTAQAIMQLAEKRKLSLNDKVSLYIPEIKNSEMTIKHLLTHYDGFADKVWPEPFDKNSNFNRYLSKALTANPDVQAGARFQYADTGFNMLGNIVAKVSGLGYSAYIERHILRPIGMRNSGYYSGPDGLRPSVEPFKNGQLIPLDQRWPFDPQFFPSEGLITHVGDLSLWVKAVLTMSPELLTKKSYRQMLVPLKVTDWGETHISLGWFITRRNNIEYAYHMGGIRGYSAIVVIEPDAKNGIILLTNSSDTPRWEIVDLIVNHTKRINTSCLHESHECE